MGVSCAHEYLCYEYINSLLSLKFIGIGYRISKGVFAVIFSSLYSGTMMFCGWVGNQWSNRHKLQQHLVLRTNPWNFTCADRLSQIKSRLQRVIKHKRLQHFIQLLTVSSLLNPRWQLITFHRLLRYSLIINYIHYTQVYIERLRDYLKYITVTSVDNLGRRYIQTRLIGNNKAVQ